MIDDSEPKNLVSMLSQSFVDWPKATVLLRQEIDEPLEGLKPGLLHEK